MTAKPLPIDSSSLLVPVHLEAWVVDTWTRNAVEFVRYTANYDNLNTLTSPMPPPFVTSSETVDDGIHLHWALPDALTHGRHNPKGPGLEFPTVPNRWLVARFNSVGGKWTGKLWVVKSDNLKPLDLGTTAGEFSSTSTTIAIAAPGLTEPIGAGAKILLIPGNGNPQAVVTSEAAGQGALSIKVFQIPSLPAPIAKGCTVQVPTTSAFLDPHSHSFAAVDAGAGTANITLNPISIGTPFSIEAWEAQQDSAADKLFLSAVGPGNVSFAAYAPFIENVFSFVDRDLPAPLANEYKYTYMISGWYSDPNSDPLHSIASFDDLPDFWKDLWTSKQAWEKQQPIERFNTLKSYLKWCSSESEQPPSSSLYHAVIPRVQWAYDPNQNGPPIDVQNVRVAVGNTSIDALSALVSAENPGDAGRKLADLLQAAQYDLLPSYGQPGGHALIEQQIHQAWFGSKPGGILWEVVGHVPGHAGQDAHPANLTPEQTTAVDTALAELNAVQRGRDKSQRELESLQSDLYVMWWKVVQSLNLAGGIFPETPSFPPQLATPGWDQLQPELLKIYSELFQIVWKTYCAVRKASDQLPNPTIADEAQKWANDPKNATWQFPATPPKTGKVTLGELGLQLKSIPMPRFWHPNDPVVLIAGLNRSQKHGEDGRDSKDGMLRCRLGGQTITGLKIDGQPTIDNSTMSAAHVFDQIPRSTKVPGVANLMHEAFFVDPANAELIAMAVKGDQSKILNAITEQSNWCGTPPVSFAITLWEQAWSPLFLEWELSYFPTGKGQAADRQFTLDDWLFDGAQYRWKGTEASTDPNLGVETGSGYDPAYFVSFKGRTFMTPQTPVTLKEKVAKYLTNHPKIDNKSLDDLLKKIGEMDLLSQSIGGFTNSLLTLKTEETFPPPPADPKETIPCPPGQAAPSVTALIGEQYHAQPIVDDTNPNWVDGSGRNQFYPVRGGFIQFQTLQVVDTFGQMYEIPLDLSPPIPAQGLIPDKPTTIPAGNTLQPLPSGAIQMPPRIVQPSRLDFRWLANDGSGRDIEVSNNSDAICGWLLPNHLDGGIAVYDEAGLALGEILPLPSPHNWRPRPGNPGKNPPPEKISDIKNQVLQKVLMSISDASQHNQIVFSDLMQVIDETLYMVDPLGGRKDQMLSVMIGRPLAVVQARLQLRLYGNPAFNQLWERMLTPKVEPFTRVKDIGVIKDISFPVRLGSLQLRNDGLIGYYLPASKEPYGTFYSVHSSPNSAAGEYIKPICKPDQQALTGWVYQGDVALNYQSDPLTVTMLLDPRGSVHATTGILPTTSVSLAGHRVEDFLKKLAVTFRTGPIIADPGTLRTPQPAESHGTWTWVQRSSPTAWEEDTAIDANDRARLPDAQLQLREGWLKFTHSGSVTDEP